ncbi:MAG: hypothetical protein Q9M36_09885 [Sulfurovum sp.]|nr:hypothetical protein [Sulfurovum sp.]
MILSCVPQEYLEGLFKEVEILLIPNAPAWEWIREFMELTLWISICTKRNNYFEMYAQ